MIITKEQQEALINNYAKKGYNQDACIGFIDGVEGIMALIGKLNKVNNYEYLICPLCNTSLKLSDGHSSNPENCQDPYYRCTECDFNIQIDLEKAQQV